jgi:hypothetical protein
LESDDQQVLRTLTPFNEFEVLGGSMQMDAEDRAASEGSYQVKVVGDSEVSIAHI